MIHRVANVRKCCPKNEWFCFVIDFFFLLNFSDEDIAVIRLFVGLAVVTLAYATA